MVHKIGNAGNNVLTGTAGKDLLDGLGGNDTLNGLAGADVMRGGTGSDIYVVDNANDVVDETGGNGVDTVKSSISFSLVAGAHVKGLLENLTLTGGANINGIGNGLSNFIIGNAGRNVLVGGAGNDTLRGGKGVDTLDGGVGVDTADYSDKTGSVHVVLAGATTVSVTVNGALEDHIKNFENVTGGSGDDQLIGDGKANVLSGGDGYDRFVGNAGNDTFIGGNGDDEVQYYNESGAQAVIVNLDSSAHEGVTAGHAKDTFGNVDTFIGVSNAFGTSHNDHFYSGQPGTGYQGFYGLAGNDTFTDNGNGVWVYYDQDANHGGGGAVTVDLGAGTATDGFGGHDTLNGIHNLRGTNGADTLTGSSEHDHFQAAGGNDQVDGGAGEDEMDYSHDGDSGGGGGLQGVIVNLSDNVLLAADSGAASDLAAHSARDSFGDTDTLVSIERVTGTDHDDFIFGGDHAGTFQSYNALGGDDDIVDGDGDSFSGPGAGTDTVDGGNDYDTVGFAGHDGGIVVSFTPGVAGGGTITGTIDGGDAVDTTFQNMERVEGSNGDDTFTADGTGFINTGNADFSFSDDRGDNRGQQHGFAVVGADGADDFFDTSDFVGQQGGFLMVNYDGEKFTHDQNQWGDDPGEFGVIVNLSDNQESADVGYGTQVVDSGFGLDTYRNFDNYVGIQSLRLTDADDVIFANTSLDTHADGRMGADQFHGGDGDDEFTGGQGNDTYDGGNGFDLVNYNSEWYDDNAVSQGGRNGVVVNLSDTTQGGQAAHSATDSFGDTDTLLNLENVYATGGNDVIYGGDTGELFVAFGGNDQIHAGAGDDFLIGDAGDDTLDGGADTDTVFYLADQFVNDNWDLGQDPPVLLDPLDAPTHGVIVNLSGADVSASDFGFADPRGDVLQAAGTAYDIRGNTDTLISIENIVGTNLDDFIYGSDDDNQLEARDGNDFLHGGNGSDTFVFNTTPDAATNLDTIDDFVVGDDTIALSAGVFDAITTAPGDTLAAGEFRSGSTANAAGQRIIYDPTNGKLYYDDDGNGSDVQTQIAVLTGNPALTASDFTVIA